MAAPDVALMPERSACMIGIGEMCEHALVDRDLNRLLFDYERIVRSRFTRIVDVLKRISTIGGGILSGGRSSLPASNSASIYRRRCSRTPGCAG